jgi:hypothetical protein
VNAALPKLEASRPLRWSKNTITFDYMDQLKCSTTAGALPMHCTPTISNVLVTKTFIDDGTGLKVLSVETFETLQVPYDQLLPTKHFSGVTNGSTVPIGQIRLPVTFGKCGNYHTELIDLDVAHIGLLYNAILGYPALTKFMAATHHSYNVLKMPGSGGIITVACDEKDVVCSLERAYQAAAVENSDDEGAMLPPKAVPKKKKQLLLKGRQEAEAPADHASGPAPTAGAPFSLA